MTYLYLLRQSPYGSTLAREALDMALASAAFDQHVQLVFLSDGVYQLINQQNAEIKQRKDISKTLSALSLYDIQEVYVDNQSLAQRNIQESELFNDAKIISSESIQALIQQADTVMTL